MGWCSSCLDLLVANVVRLHLRGKSHQPPTHDITVLRKAGRSPVRISPVNPSAHSVVQLAISVANPSQAS